MSVNGRKKSAFPASTIIPSGAKFDFVSGGVNYSIVLADLLTALAVTGTIVQGGASTATPVHDSNGTVNIIRNLEDGSGVKASLSPQNGITLAHNFTVDATGVPVMGSPALLSPVIRSIIAGQDINVALDGDAIQISSSAVAAGTKTVVVNVKGDLPSAVSSVITLAADTSYQFTNDINLGTDRLVLASDTSLVGTGVLNITLTYTGTGNMISWSNVAISVSNLRLSCVSGTVFSGTNISEILRFQNISIETCDKIASFASTTSTNIRMTFVACKAAASDGMAFSGTFAAFGYNTGLLSLSGGHLFRLGTSVFTFFSISTAVAALAAGTTALSGVAASANVAANGLARVISSQIVGAGTTFSGIADNDFRWVFAHNNGVHDSHTSGLASMQANATNTVIAATDTPVLVAGTWTAESNSHTTVSTAGRITYIGERGANAVVMSSLSLAPVTGTNIGLSVYVAVNGSVIANSKRSTTASSGAPTSASAMWQIEVVVGDYIEMFVENNDTTSDILVSSAIHGIS